VTGACIGIRAVLWASRQAPRYRHRAVVTTEQRRAAAARFAQQPLTAVTKALQLAHQYGAVSAGMVCKELGLHQAQAETLLDAMAEQHLLVSPH
jgi:hypothetical protein